jgi:ABC-type branched-subunit amino acid transport system substrate-binding protein
MRGKLRTNISIGLLLAMVIAACGGGNASTTEAVGTTVLAETTTSASATTTPTDTTGSSEAGLAPGTYKFGFIGPLTGAVAFAGIGVQAGIEAAFDQANESGQFGEGVELELQSEDDANDQAKGIAATELFINDPDIVGLLCCVSSSVTGSIKPLIDEGGVPSIITTALLGGATDGDFMFRPRPDQVAINSMLVTAVVEAFQPETALVVLNSDNEGTAAIGNLMGEELVALGVELLPTVSVLQDDTDMSGPATTIIAANPDLVFHAENSQNMALMIRELEARGYEGNNIGTNALVDSAIFETCGPACVGVPFVETYWPNPSNPSSFMQEWLPTAQEASGEDLPSTWFASGQTAAIMLFEALNQLAASEPGTAITRENLTSALGNVDSFETPLGTMSMDDEGQGSVDAVLLMQLDSSGSPQQWDGTVEGLIVP